MENMKEYICKVDLLNLVEEEIKFAKVADNTDRLISLFWVKAIINTVPILEVVEEDDEEEEE